MSKGAQFLKGVFVLVGALLVSLSVLLPVSMETATIRRGAPATFGSTYLRSLTPFITIASMATCFISAAVILSFESSRPGRRSVLLGLVTLSVLVSELTLSVYLSLIRPLTSAGRTPVAIYALMGLVPLGLACTMFTLASIISGAT